MATKRRTADELAKSYENKAAAIRTKQTKAKEIEDHKKAIAKLRGK